MEEVENWRSLQVEGRQFKIFLILANSNLQRRVLEWKSSVKQHHATMMPPHSSQVVNLDTVSTVDKADLVNETKD